MEKRSFDRAEGNSTSRSELIRRAPSIRARASFNGNLKIGPENDWMRSHAVLVQPISSVRLAAFVALIADVTVSSTIVIGTTFR